MILHILSILIGGLGLFLLGMNLMTKGLRNAAGPSLRTILGKWTKTPLRGLASGFLITTLVQSSSAVTVAVIGFVNAGLMSMAQSIGVILGSNIGTTVTGWIVAAVGVSVEVKALALPMVGLGAALRLTGGKTRRKDLGDALTGFGVFFLGIEVLQSAFHTMESSIDLAAINIGGMSGIILFVFVGFALTLLMQSSSAAMALVLTAAMSGIVSMENAAAAVIGTNIGTTTTALLSVIGATSNAKKVAASHIIFNLITGLIAIFLIPPFLELTSLKSMSEFSNPATALAFFHTFFNLLGVCLFIPFTHRLVFFLDQHIGKKEADISDLRYLDNNVIETPTLAMDALFMELGRVGEMTMLMGQKALTSQFRHKDFIKDQASLSTLIASILKYCVKMQHMTLSSSIAAKLPVALRVIQYFRKCVQIMDDMSQKHALLDHQLPGVAATTARAFRREVRLILNIAHEPCTPEFMLLQQKLNQLSDIYHELKDELLRIGAQNRLDLNRMVSLLDYYSHMRMMCEQAVKGTIHWTTLRTNDHNCSNATDNNNYAWKPQD